MAFFLVFSGQAAAQSGSFISTASMGTSRLDFSLTRLCDGRVLAAGGTNASGVLNTAQVYNPLTGTWTSTGGLVVARTGHSATLLPDCRVLVAGGFASGSPLSSAEVYDPSATSCASTGCWSATGSMIDTRNFPTAVLLNNGKVLVAAGSFQGAGDSFGRASAELFDPTNTSCGNSTGCFTSTGSLNTARMNQLGVPLPDGKVLVTGGQPQGVSFASFASTEIYDPTATSCGSTGCWSFAGSMAIGRRQVFSLTRLADGRVLVAGGNTGPFAGAITAKAELFDQADTSCGNSNGCWSDTAAADMPSARAGQSATLLADGNVLAAGGHFDSTLFNTALIYDPGLNTWSAPITMGEQRTQARAAALSDGSVLVAGGFGSSFQVLSSAELYLKTVAIDIKPGGNPNTIKLSSKGNIPVAILSSADFDAPSQVNRSSLTFGKTGNESSQVGCSTVPQDVNGDGFPDLVCKFNTQAAGFTTSDTVGKLKGKTTSGIAIRGSDSVRIIP